VLDLYMRLDDTVSAAESAVPQVLRDALGAELADRNLLGNAGDLVARSDSRSTTATTSC